MELKGKYIDLNYEEVSPSRSVSDAQFSNGLQSFNFNVSPSGGKCCLPQLSYFLIEYNWGSAKNKTDNYTATEALSQNQKITLQNNWASCLYNASRFTLAQSEVSVCNSSHAQAHTLKQRMLRNTEFFEKLGFDLDGYDPDFSRRLARHCKDGTYHRDGLVDCSPYNSDPYTSDAYGAVKQYSKAVVPLLKDVTETYYLGSEFSTAIAPAVNIYPFMSRGAVFNITAGPDAVSTANNDLATAVVRTISWELPAFSSTPGNAAQNAAVIDGLLISLNDNVKFYVGDTTAEKKFFNEIVFTVVELKDSGSKRVMHLKTRDDSLLIPNTLISVFGATPLVGSGIVSVVRKGYVPLTQQDPRSNVVNSVVAYQPPIAFFDVKEPVFYGDMLIEMTPNSNWTQACIESAVPGSFYGTDVKHGIDYCFGVKSVRLYLATARILSSPSKTINLIVEDIQISNKQLSNRTSIINMNIPVSTQTIICWVQDSACGSNSKLPLTRFKTRQNTFVQGLTNDLSKTNKYGLWAHTMDENLYSLQLNFAGITKPSTNFSRGSGAGDPLSSTTNYMLQRYIMNNQNMGNKQSPETYHDWLSMGPYYAFDFTRSADNLGTYLTVNIAYNGDLPTDGNIRGSATLSNVNLYVACIYKRAVQMNYGEYGNVVSVQTQLL